MRIDACLFVIISSFMAILCIFDSGMLKVFLNDNTYCTLKKGVNLSAISSAKLIVKWNLLYGPTQEIARIKTSMKVSVFNK